MVRAAVRTEGPASPADLSHVEERARLALEPFRPRVGRATLRVRQAGAGEVVVELSVPLGAAGTVRVRGRGTSVRPCAETVIHRAASLVAQRLRAERQELLEFLLLAGGEARSWASPSGGERRGRSAAKAARDGSRKHGSRGGRGAKAAA